MSRRPPRVCRHPLGGQEPCRHCRRWTCIECHHSEDHLKKCPPTRKEARR